MRARRPRPSEKTTARVIPGFSPLGHPCRAGPPAEGRAPHARKEGPGLTEARRHRPTASGPPILGNERPRHEHGLAMRTHGVHPSEKTVFRAISEFPRKGIPARLCPFAEGRAPHARKNRMTPTHMSPPFGHQPFARPSVIMTSPGLRPARTCGRAERVPPRKPPSTSSPALPPKGLYLKDPEWHNTGHLIGMTIG